MKKFIMAVILVPVILYSQTRELTLKESLEIGLKNSKDLKISYSKLVSASAQVTSANSQLLPQLTFNAGYTRLSNIPPFDVSLPIFPEPIVVSPVILDNYTLKTSLQQPLFTGFRLTSLRDAAKSNYDAANSDYQSDMNEIAFKIQDAFWNYYESQLNDSVLGENLNQIKQHLDDTKNFLANGQVIKNDYLKLEVQYSSVNLQKIEADNSLDIARMTFNQAINLPLDAQTQIKVEEPEIKVTDYNIEDLQSEAKNNRNELKALEYRLYASIENVRASNSAWYPSVYLFGDYYDDKPNGRILPAVNEFKYGWDAGVTLSWTIWNWGYNSSQSTIAEQNKIQTETSLSQLKDAVEIEVYQNYLTFKRAYDKVSVSKLGVDQSEENYRITKDMYNNQTETATDLIDSEAALLQAETNYNNALVDYEVAKIRLEKSVGKKIY
ncbi:MAG: TolC family protein [Ignavibacteriaceae bacterium]|jgi:outer membrane protein TolC